MEFFFVPGGIADGPETFRGEWQPALGAAGSQSTASHVRDFTERTAWQDETNRHERESLFYAVRSCNLRASRSTCYQWSLWRKFDFEPLRSRGQL
jgi:hypothetical protein